MAKQDLIIGIFGLGTVGSGVVELIQQQANRLQSKYGLKVTLKAVVVRKISPDRVSLTSPAVLSTDPAIILEDKEINTVIEVIGGIHPAKEYILRALQSHKNVITANKALLAECGVELFEAALRHKCYFGFRAAVTGLQDMLERFYSSISITNIAGVFNGTCNYILTDMEEKGEEFSEALKKAQAAGYAEQDPTLDINGQDTADKLAIISTLAFNSPVQRKDIYTEGIERISLDDIRFARELGYKIKLLGIAGCDGKEIEAKVYPCLIPADNILASLKGVENGIQIDDELRGPGGFKAPGAGKYPTGNAVLFDIINLSNDNPTYIPKEFVYLPVKKIEQMKNQYYLRVAAVNQPGVLARIAGVFQLHDINILSVLQERDNKDKRGEVVPLVIITDTAGEKSMQKAVADIESLAIIKGQATLLRVEERFW
ncbi:MAG: homoserine dehydrogenase [Candidatus Schekmanbacteria bacterium]|nr:homoserine dehydrogenase [Candidatus Schekmanbacteria bacterium]